MSSSRDSDSGEAPTHCVTSLEFESESRDGKAVESVFFNAHHAPVGAFATLTLGSKGARGGLGLEIGGPADEDLYVGIEDRERSGEYRALPFFAAAPLGFDSQDFDVESLSGIGRVPKVHPFADSSVQRDFAPSVDIWRAEDLELRIYSPAKAVPDPENALDENLKYALTPAVVAELEIDNREGAFARKAFFGYAGSDRIHAMRSWECDALACIGQASTAIGTASSEAYGGTAFQPESILDPTNRSNLNFMLGKVGLLVVTVPPGERRTFRFAIAFFREGTVTAGLPARYLYRRFFSTIEDVLDFALSHFERNKREAEAQAARWAKPLSPERARMLAQAIGSYYGSTQCLELEDGRPLWVVNEGEYRMMNTLDLMPDQAFFELAMNPWTVRSELDFYVDRHAYMDQAGIAFSHDVGVANAFALPGRSAYEQAGLKGCFSFMSCEELVNWVLCAAMYGLVAGDREWLSRRASVLEQCLDSLIRRDGEPSNRNGLMGVDSDRCRGGSEITTYDSLDSSLGQARNNLYLGVKLWAAYVLLERVFTDLGARDLAEVAHRQSLLGAETVASAAGPDGMLPALLEEGSVAKLIPVIEGLAFPLFMGMEDVLSPIGEYGCLLETLKRHVEAVLGSGLCKFPDGGWRLSSTSVNSWLSKIYLCQFVAERLFGQEPDRLADEAHLAWLMRPENAYSAWSDQMLDGMAVGSRYYPRGVTAFLWLSKTPLPPLWNPPALSEVAP